MTKKILNQAQANAVYDAMCALNNVGGSLKTSFQLTTVEEVGGRWIMIKDHSTGVVEEYDGQSIFATAYEVL